MSEGFTIRITVPKDEPHVRIINRTGWDGRGYFFLRGDYQLIKRRPISNETGVYILFGRTETGEQKVYIGEGDVFDRINRHLRDKDFWTAGLIFVSTNSSLNKTLVEYIEHRLCMIVREAGNCILDNGNNPKQRPINEADHYDGEAFLSQILLVAPFFIDIFEKRENVAVRSDVYEMAYKGVSARGIENAEGFLVLKGSSASRNETKTISRHTKGLRAELEASGILRREEGRLVFTADWQATAPSAAASVVAGGSVNGRALWKKNGRSMNDIDGLAAVEDPEPGS